MVRGGVERLDRASDDTHGRVFPLFAALQNDLQGPAMPSGACTQPQFSGQTYRFNRSKTEVRATQRSTTDVLGRSEEHKSELQYLMRTSSDGLCCKKKNTIKST